MLRLTRIPVASLAIGVLLATVSVPATLAAPLMVAAPAQNAPDPAAKITFYAGLPYQGAALVADARKIATPDGPMFRKFETLEMARRKYGASPAAVGKLRAAAQRLGLKAEIDGTGFFARLTGTVAQWEQLMGAQVQYSSAQTNVFLGQAANDTYVFSSIPQIEIVGGIPLPSRASVASQTSSYLPPPAALARSITWFLPSYAEYVASADSGQGAPSAQVTGGQVLVYPGNGTTPLPVNTGTPLGSSCVATGAESINGETGAAGQAQFFTPDQIGQAYAMGGLQRNAGAAASNEVAIISLNGGFLASDVQNAANCFGHVAPSIRVVRGDGVGTEFNNVNGETSLDLQTVSWALRNARSIRLIQVTNSATSFLDGYSTLLTDPAGPPLSASLSYGSCEQGAQTSPGWRTQEDLYALAGILGTSLFVSSGDTGSAVCQVGVLLEINQLVESVVGTLGEANVPQSVIAYFEELGEMASTASAAPGSTVSYPASSPWVTAVGATQLVLGENNAIIGENVWNDLQYGASGNAVSTGGPSGIYANPWYQPAATAADRRIVPDIVAMGAISPAMPLYVNGKLQIVGGTSEATPMMAAAMAMISAKRAGNGAAPLGFVNPLLYQIAREHPAVFRDVTVGTNQYPVQYAPGSLNIAGCCEAIQGFDAASGLGSINFARLAKLTVR
jgi:subtilase family serine protease